MTLANKMIEYRAKHNLSQKALAQITGVSLQTINSVENELQKPSKLTEAKILMAIKEDKEDKHQDV